MRKIRLSTLLFFFILIASLRAQTPGSELLPLLTHFKKAAGFDYAYPREKVYLHLDNNGYFVGDTIWFKAYVVRASSLQPSTLSRVLYVELLDAGGRMVTQKLLRLDSLGQAHGELGLDLPVHAGYHEVRAYTREMTNWGEQACFSRVVPVFDKQKEGGELDIPSPEVNKDKGKLIAQPRPLYGEHPRRTYVSFYPEGGHRVGGVDQRIAFRMTDGCGRPLVDTVRIFLADGTPVTMAESEHEGLGMFRLPSSVRSAYAVCRGKKFPLPEPVENVRYGLRADRVEGGVSLLCSGNENARGGRGELMGLAVFCRGKAAYFDTLRVGRESVEVFLSEKAFHGGVNSIVLFDSAGRCVAQRPSWHQASERRGQVAVLQNKESYEPFEPIALDMTVKDAEGRPLQTTFSLSVRDDGGELVRAEATDTRVDLLLASELKGYIHRPEYYFEADDEIHRRHLDLLLLVQGWTANSFEQMCGVDSVRFAQPIEERLTLNGRVYRDNNKMEPYPGLSMHIQMYSREGASLGAVTTTDKDGRFAFESNVDYTGDWIAQITTKDEKQKKKWSRVTFDRWFSPRPRLYYGQEVDIERPLPPADTLMTGGKPHTFVWKDTIRRVVNFDLGEAVATGKRRYQGLSGDRYSWNGGERTGMRNAYVFLNVEREVERYKDMGKAPGTALEFIAYLINGGSLRYDHIQESENYAGAQTGIVQSGAYGDGSGETADAGDALAEVQQKLWIKSEEAAVYLGNTSSPNLGVDAYMAEEIRSAAVVRNEASRLMLNATESSRRRYSVFVYEEPEFYRFKTRKGTDKRRIQGYSKPVAFFSPSYNGIDLPSPSDLRRTLYWNPSVTTDKDGHAGLVFYNNSRSGVNLRLSLRGVTGQGDFVNYER